MTIKLHCFGESGHSYKVAQALEFAGVDWEPVFIDFFNGGARTKEFHELNPMAEAPVFIDDEKGLKLSQSGVILDYIVESTGKLGPKNDTERREILRWTLWDNHKMSAQIGMLRFLMNFLAEEKRPQEVIGFVKGRTKIAFSVLDTALSDRGWLVGDGLTTADLSCCSYLYYPEPFGFDRADWPNIDAWLTRISEMPEWKHPYDLMPRTA
ncbi:MAG: glutathione S-transferase family protein [Pseudoruegeria sp.]